MLHIWFKVAEREKKLAAKERLIESKEKVIAERDDVVKQLQEQLGEQSKLLESMQAAMSTREGEEGASDKEQHQVKKNL